MQYSPHIARDMFCNWQVSGKIVVYNYLWQGSYPPALLYRREGAYRAAQKGAVAALVRSVTDFSIASPHTGTQVGSFYCSSNVI